MDVRSETPPPYGPEPERPSDDEIVRVLADHYKIPEIEVFDWLVRMDMWSVYDRMKRRTGA